jgi:endonuclease YncB( thermonuclease family)
MLASNGASVALFVGSLFDFFVAFGVIVAVLALIAFSPGETMEKIIRPLMSGMIGAIFGGLIALTMVGTGFGSRAPSPAYGGAASAHDGNTLLVQDTLVRLRGVNAPLPGQICRRPNGTAFDCGAQATVALNQIIRGSDVLCARDNRPETTGQNAQPNNQQQAAGENGREPVVTCTLMGRDGPPINIGQSMVEEGYAASRGDVFAREAQIAQTNPRNLTAWCSLRPEVWARRSTAERNAFRDRGIYLREWATFGTCSPPPVSRRTEPRNTRERSAPD